MSAAAEIDLIQVLIFATGLIGNILVAQKRVSGFVVWLVSNALLIHVCLEQALYGMLALYVAYTGLCLYGIWNWRRSDMRPASVELDDRLLRRIGWAGFLRGGK